MVHRSGHSHREGQSQHMPTQKMVDRVMLPCRMDLHPRHGVHGKIGSFGQTQMANRGESPHQRQVRQLRRHTISHGGLEMMTGVVEAQQVTLLKGVPQAHA